MIFNVVTERKMPSILEVSIRQQGSAPERKPIATITKMIRNVKINIQGTTFDFPQAYANRVDFPFSYTVEPQDASIYGFNIVKNGDGGGTIGGSYHASAIVKKTLLSKKKFDFNVYDIMGRKYLVFKVGPGGRPYYYVVKNAMTQKTVFMFEYINSNLDGRTARILVDDVTAMDDSFLMFAMEVVIPIPVDEMARVLDPPRETYISIDEEKALFDEGFLERVGAE